MKPRSIIASAIAIIVLGFGASASRAQTASVPDPVPPRMFSTTGFTGSNAYTLPTARGFLAAGYAGADWWAQFSDDDEFTSLPFIVHAAYGIQDYLTLELGSGVWRYEYEEYDETTTSGADFYPYLAPKVRIYNREPLTTSIRGIIVFPTEIDGFLYGASLELSSKITEQANGHLSVGFTGYSVEGTYSDERETDREVVLAFGGDVLAFTPGQGQIKIFGEFRRIVVSEKGFAVLTAGARFLTNSLGAELGFTRWFEEDFDVQPILSVSYRF